MFVLVTAVMFAAWFFALCTLNSDEEIFFSVRLTGWSLLVLGGGYLALSLVAALILPLVGVDLRSLSL